MAWTRPGFGLVQAWFWLGYGLVLNWFWLGFGSFFLLVFFFRCYFGFGLVKAWFWPVFSSLETKHNLFFCMHLPLYSRLYAPTTYPNIDASEIWIRRGEKLDKKNEIWIKKNEI